jgi:transposase-like protein
VKVAGRCRYVYRAIDQFGQVIDPCFRPARREGGPPVLRARHPHHENDADGGRHRQAGAYQVVLEEQLPAAWHRTDRYANNHIECDHGRLKSRLRAMRGLKQDRSAGVVTAGHGFVQNLRRVHHELAVEEPVARRVTVAFDELALVI